MPGAAKAIRVLYVYGAADRSGADRIPIVREGLTKAGFVIEPHEFFVIDWGRFAVNPRDHDRRALLDNRFGATDADARALLRSVIHAKLPKSPLTWLFRGRIEKLEILTPYRNVADGAYPMLLDVLAYLRNTENIVSPSITRIAELVATSRRPVIAIGLSLGGIILVDALARWSRQAADADRAPLKLLTTVGSQSPMLQACDALLDLRRDGESPPPFVPWLNIWRRLDLLSYPARPMFVDQFPDETDLRDVVLDPGADPEVFPQAHASYFNDPRVYAEIARMLTDLGTAFPDAAAPEADVIEEGFAPAAARAFPVEAGEHAVVVRI